ncbi:MAG: hypothetical protein K5634_06380, partial [Sphaerochaetaceae bacterium]|nr:hypothetical protein [Sphaerochaetaceae bacterium]
MFRTYKKIPALLAIFILFLCVAAATEYKITDYRYEIDGFTKVWALANRVEGKDEVFSSVEELEKALADKRQTLWNTSLFYHVNCTWEETGRSGDTVFVTAIIAVEDSGSSIILPYPKYDSNTGFSLGLRYKNNNFMGTLGNAAASLDWEQDGKSFSQSN